MRSIAKIKEDIANTDSLLAGITLTRKQLASELWDAQRAKSKRRPDSATMNAINKAKFADQVVPGVFVRVIGARSYPWKYVESVDGDSFIGKAVNNGWAGHLGRRGYRVLFGNVSTTMIGKVREVLTPEEFDERFGKQV